MNRATQTGSERPLRPRPGVRTLLFVCVATIGGACSASAPTVRPPAHMAVAALAVHRARTATGTRDQVTPSYFTPDPHVLAIALAEMEARQDSTLRDRYLNDVREKTGCTIQATVARLPARPKLMARVQTAESPDLAKLARDPNIARIAAAHVAPITHQTVTPADDRTAAVAKVS